MSGKLYKCPVDGCSWAHVEPEADPATRDPNLLASVFGPGVMASAAAVQRAERIERVLETHLRSHTVQEWVGTVSRLQMELERHRSGLVAAKGG